VPEVAWGVARIKSPDESKRRTYLPLRTIASSAPRVGPVVPGIIRPIRDLLVGRLARLVEPCSPRSVRRGLAEAFSTRISRSSYSGLRGVLGKLSGLPGTADRPGAGVVFAGVTLGAFVLIRRPVKLLVRRRDLVVLGALGVLLAAHWTAFFESVNVSTARRLDSSHIRHFPYSPR